jgi:outer membrane usher protein FimD/PapC
MFRRTQACLIVGLCLFFVATHTVFSAEGRVSNTDDYDALYQKLFGKPFVRVLQPYEATIVIQGRVFGTISLMAPPTGPVDSFSGVEFSRVLKSFLQEDAYAKLETMIDAEGQISAEKLVNLGYGFSFGRSRRLLTVTVPKSLRNPVVYIDLHSGQLQPQSSNYHGVSGYVNLLGRVSHSENLSNFRADPLSLDALSVVNMNGLVFKSQGNFNAQSSIPYEVQSVQLLADDQTQWTRYVLGDNDFPIHGFQGYTGAFGVGVGRMYYLNPILAERGYQELRQEIPDDGQLSLFINDKKVWEGSVEKGTYVFESAPIQLGVNRVLFVFKPDNGEVALYSDLRIRDPRLIGVGDQDFYYHAGFLSENTNRVYQIDRENPVFSGYHMFGMSSAWLQSGYFQKDKDHQILGLESFFPTEWGLFRVHGSRYSDVVDAGNLLELSQSSYYDPKGWLRYHELNYLKKEAFFRRFGSSSDDVLQKLSLNTQFQLDVFQLGVNAFAQDYYSRLGRSYGVSLGIGQVWAWFSTYLNGSYSQDADGLENYAGTALLYTNFSKEWRGEVSLQTRKQYGEPLDTIVSYRLNWFLGGGDSLSVSDRSYFDSQRQQELAYRGTIAGVGTDTSFRFSPNGSRELSLSAGVYDPYNAFSLQSALSDKDGDQQGQHFLRYWNTRGGANVTYTHTKSSEGVRSYTTEYQLETAIAFADGQVAVGRPIRDNFVLVYPEKSLSGQSFEVGQNSRVDMFGPALISDLQPLYESRIALGRIEEVPDGYDLGPTYYRVTPGYHTGRAIRVGNGFRKQVFGVVLAAGVPMRYVVVDIFREEDPDKVINRILTGSKGQFMIQGLQPGKYGLRFQAMTDGELHFELNEDPSVLQYDFGVLDMPEIVPVD